MVPSASNPTESGSGGSRVNRGRALNRRRQRGLEWFGMVQGLRKDAGLGVLPQSRKPPITPSRPTRIYLSVGIIAR